MESASVASSLLISQNEAKSFAAACSQLPQHLFQRRNRAVPESGRGRDDEEFFGAGVEGYHRHAIMRIEKRVFMDLVLVVVE
jgi:hypothetical protein